MRRKKHGRVTQDDTEKCTTNQRLLKGGTCPGTLDEVG